MLLADVLDDLTRRGLVERLEGIEVSSDVVKFSLRPPAVGSGGSPQPSAGETFKPGSRAPETMAELVAQMGIKLPERET